MTIALAAVLGLVALLYATPSAGAPTPNTADQVTLDGKEIFLAQKCDLCHTVSSAGIEAKTKSDKMKGPDLTTAEKRDPKLLADFMRKTAQIDDQDHKKEFKGSDEELGALLSWIQEQQKKAK
jgi:hypothetical protein